MRRLFIITGVSRGLGYSLAKEILYNNHYENFVLGLGRSNSDLSKNNPKNYVWIKTDLLKLKKVNSKLDKVIGLIHPDTICFISNAGEINPISHIGGHKFESINNSLSINIISPLIILNHLINNHNSKKLLLVNITSTAVYKSIEGWSLYSSSKSYMKMYFDILEKEQSNNLKSSISVLQIDPGAMDTDMQKEIRKTKIVSEQQKKLIEVHQRNLLANPSDVARKIYFQIDSCI